jgi:uncharacterized protein involved in exopolysaccharide biosynthesis
MAILEPPRPVGVDPNYLPVPQLPDGNGKPEPPSTDLRDLIEIAFKRRRMILAVFLSMAVPGIVVTLSKRPDYAASGAILIKSQRVHLAVAPGEEPRPINAPVNASVVNSEVQVLKSKMLLRDVVQRIAKETGAEPSTIAPTIAGRIDVAPIRDSNAIQVSYTSEDPAVSVRVINTLLDAYVDFHAQVHSSPKLLEFYQQQLARREAEVWRARERLARYEKRRDIVAARPELKVAADNLAATTAALATTDIRIAELRRRVQETETELAKLPKTEAVQKRLVLNPTWESLLRRRDELVAKRRERSERYKGTHRSMLEVDENVAAIERELSTTQKFIVGTEVIGDNTTHRTLVDRLVVARIDLGAAEAKRALLKTELKAERSQLRRQRRFATKVGRLQGRIGEIDESRKLFSTKVDEAKIAQAMDREQLVNVAIVDRPRLPLQPVESLSGVLATFTSTAALGVALGLAYVLEFLRRAFRKEPDLERYLGVPALGTVREF